MVNLKSKFLGIIYLMAGLSGCQDKELLYSAPPEIDAYIQIFLKEAAHRGKHIDLYAEGLVVNFGTLSGGKAGRCRPNDFPKQITIDSSQWEKLDAPQREVLVFHELGHCILNRDHNNNLLPFGECASLMDGNDEEGGFICFNNYYTSQWRKYYLDELFDSSTTVPDWYQIPPRSVIDKTKKQKIYSKKDSCLISNTISSIFKLDAKVPLENHSNYLIEMTYHHPLSTETLRLEWNDIIFTYSFDNKKAKIKKQSYNWSVLESRYYALLSANNLFNMKDLCDMDYPVKFSILKIEDRLYFYLNEIAIHTMEFDYYQDESTRKYIEQKKNHFSSTISMESMDCQLDIFTY